MKKILYVLVVFFAVSLFATPVYADKCGKKDRVPLPACVDYSITEHQKRFDVYNKCSYPVTVKVDIDNESDKRITVNPGKKQIGSTENDRSGDMFVEMAHVLSGGAKIRALKCCPNYGRCG